MLPTVLLMHRLDGSHSEASFGGSRELPSKDFLREFFLDIVLQLFSLPSWGPHTGSPYRAPIGGGHRGSTPGHSTQPALSWLGASAGGFGSARLGFGF